MRSCRHASALLVTGAVLLTAIAARAASSSSQPRQVEVILVGAIGHERTLPERIRSWFDPGHFVIHVRSSDTLDAGRVLGPSQDRAAHVWITSSTPEHARFYFALASEDGSTTAYLMRDLPLSHGLDELAAERIAQVCFLSTMALVEGQSESRRDDVEKSVLAEETASNAPAPNVESSAPSSGPFAPGASPTHPRGSPSTNDDETARDIRGRSEPSQDSSRRIWHFGAGYGVELRRGEGVGQGPRAGASARFAGFGVVASVQSALPATIALHRLDLHLYALSFVAALELRRDAGAFTLAMHAGPGLDVVHYRPEPTDAAVRAGPSATEARSALDIGGSVELGRRLPGFALVVDLEILFGLTHYDLVSHAQRMILASPGHFVPTFGAELRF